MAYVPPRQRRQQNTETNAPEYLTPRQRRQSKPNQPNLAILNRVDDETMAKYEAENPKDGRNILQKTIDFIKPTPALKKMVAPAIDIGLKTLQTPQDLVLNASRNIMNIATGKPLSYQQGLTFSDYSKSLPVDYVQKAKEKSPFLGGLAQGTGEALTDPTTYFAGGVVDDAVKAGRLGKSAIKGSTENLVKTAETQVKSSANIVEETAKKAEKPNELIDAVRNQLGLSKSETAATSQAVKHEVENIDAVFKQAKNERGFSKNVRTDEAMNPEIRKAFDENPLTYDPLTNKETLSKANEKMSAGWLKAYTEWNKKIDSFDPSDIPLARMLANEAAQKGDVQTARQIIADVSEKLTQAGQYSQAASILRKSDPSAFQMFVEKQFSKLNEQGKKIYGNKWNDVRLSDDEIKQIHNSTALSEESREKLMEGIYNRVSQTLPSSKMEKFDAWRRMAMLLNPKTHIRNVVGNGIMAAMRKSADTIGAGFEKLFLKEGQRTKAIGWSFDSKLKQTVDDVWRTEKDNLSNSSRWDINNLRVINRDKRIFKNNTLNDLDNFSKGTLDTEDKVFLERAYKDALGGYMKANRMNVATDAAKEYAKRRAFEATFKQANFISETINKAKRVKGVGKLVEGAIPFSQTPANIALRSVEYSPLGYIKALFGRDKGGAQIIEDIAKASTGTAALGLGYVLASMGAAKGKRSTSDIAAGLESEAGEQPYSIIGPWGSYTFDWAQPSAVPFAMGVSMREALEKKNASAAEAVMQAIIDGGDTLVNMTMLRTIKDILGGSGSATQKILGIPIAYIEQAIPSLSGQLARTIDNTKRNTYDPNPVKRTYNQVMSKIPTLPVPGLDKIGSGTLEPKLDVFGKEQSNGGLLQQFLSPGYAKGKSDDAVTKELARLYKKNKETDFLPKVLAGSFTQDGVEYRLSARDLTEMQRKLGEQTYSKMREIVTKDIDDETKMKQLGSTVQSVYNKLKKEYLREQLGK